MLVIAGSANPGLDFLYFCNMALIDWVSKRQPTIETSVFGAEFVAMKHGTKKLW